MIDLIGLAWLPYLISPPKPVTCAALLYFAFRFPDLHPVNTHANTIRNFFRGTGVNSCPYCVKQSNPLKAIKLPSLGPVPV